MGLSWITVLKAVPWAEVVRNAPAIADGARKLWDNARNKAPAAPAAATPTPPEAPPAETGLAARVTALQVQSDELQRQMAESGALINALASQNTELIRRVDALQKRQHRLLWALAVLAALTLLLASRL